MYLNTNAEADDETESLKTPYASVCVPVASPFTDTLTPGNGNPSAAPVTLPVTVLFWAKLMVNDKAATKNDSKIFFISDC